MLLWGMLLGAAPAQSREPAAVRVMTYNIQYGNGASLEEIAALIREQNPDFVALQEVDCKTRREYVSARQHGRDFITELGQLTGMFPLYGKTIPLTGGFYGIGILSSRPCIRTEKTMLPKADGNEEARALLLAEVELGDADTIVFACTHIDFTTPQTRMPHGGRTTERRALSGHRGRGFQLAARLAGDRDVRFLGETVPGRPDPSGRCTAHADRLPVGLSRFGLETATFADIAGNVVRPSSDRFGGRAAALIWLRDTTDRAVGPFGA